MKPKEPANFATNPDRIESELETPFCPLCQESLASPVLSGRDDWIPDGVAQSLQFSIVRCSACGTCYTTPRFREVSKGLAFLGSYPFYRRARQASGPLTTNQTQAFEKRAQEIAKVFPKPERILDIGMGDGAFLQLMRRRGWETCGIDTEPDVVSYACHQLGLTACQVADAELDPLPAGPFDVVTMWGMFQLAYRPQQLLEKIRAVLSPDGVIGIGVSNISSTGARLFGAHWRGLGLPRHLVHYDPTSLSRLVERSGFRVLDLTFETPYWIVAPSVKAAVPLPGILGGVAKRLVYLVLSPLGNTRLGDTMILLARNDDRKDNPDQEKEAGEKNRPLLS